jgi:hypothetical protein
MSRQRPANGMNPTSPRMRPTKPARPHPLPGGPATIGQEGSNSGMGGCPRGTATVCSASEVHEATVVSVKVASMTTALALGLGLASCSADGESATSGDCQIQVGADGTSYTSYGHTRRSALRYSSADEADCEDVGEDADGSVFPEHPRQVTTWAFSGFSPVKVLGVRIDQESFVVFVADSVPPEERDRIYRNLAEEARCRSGRCG